MVYNFSSRNHTTLKTDSLCLRSIHKEDSTVKAYLICKLDMQKITNLLGIKVTSFKSQHVMQNNIGTNYFSIYRPLQLELCKLDKIHLMFV